MSAQMVLHILISGNAIYRGKALPQLGAIERGFGELKSDRSEFLDVVRRSENVTPSYQTLLKDWAHGCHPKSPVAGAIWAGTNNLLASY